MIGTTSGGRVAQLHHDVEVEAFGGIGARRCAALQERNEASEGGAQDGGVVAVVATMTLVAAAQVIGRGNDRDSHERI